MNLVDVIVVKVIIEPYQQEDGNWTTTVLTDCWGRKQEKTITDNKKWKVEKYEKGYSWRE
jgi:hypothetical protein